MISVVQKADYDIELELGDNNELLFHIPHIRRWSPSVYKDILVSVTYIQDWARSRGIDTVYAGAPLKEVKALKFQMMCGFEPLTRIQLNGEVWQMMAISTDRLKNA